MRSSLSRICLRRFFLAGSGFTGYSTLFSAMLCLTDELSSFVNLSAGFGPGTASLSSLLSLLELFIYTTWKFSCFSLMSLSVSSIGFFSSSASFSCLPFPLKNLSLIPMGSSTATKRNRQNAMAKVQAMLAALEDEQLFLDCSTRQQTIKSTVMSISTPLQRSRRLIFWQRPLQQSMTTSTTRKTAAKRKRRNWQLIGTTTMMGRMTFLAKLTYITFFSVKYSTRQQQAQDISKMRMCRQMIDSTITTLFRLNTSETRSTRLVSCTIMKSTLSRNFATWISTFSLNFSMQVAFFSSFSSLCSICSFLSVYIFSKITSSRASSFCSCCFFLRTAMTQMRTRRTSERRVKAAISAIFWAISDCWRQVFRRQYLLEERVQSEPLYFEPRTFQIMRYCRPWRTQPMGLTHAMSTRLYNPKVCRVRNRQKLSLLPIRMQEPASTMKRMMPSGFALPPIVSTHVPVWYTLDQQALGMVAGSSTAVSAVPLAQDMQLTYCGPVQLKQEQWQPRKSTRTHQIIINFFMICINYNQFSTRISSQLHCCSGCVMSQTCSWIFSAVAF